MFFFTLRPPLLPPLSFSHSVLLSPRHEEICPSLNRGSWYPSMAFAWLMGSDTSYNFLFWASLGRGVRNPIRNPHSYFTLSGDAFFYHVEIIHVPTMLKRPAISPHGPVRVMLDHRDISHMKFLYDNHISNMETLNKPREVILTP